MKKSIEDVINLLWIFTIDEPDLCTIELDNTGITFVGELESQPLQFRTKLSGDLNEYNLSLDKFQVDIGEVWHLINQLITYVKSNCEIVENYMVMTEIFEHDWYDDYCAKVWSKDIFITFTEENELQFDIEKFYVMDDEEYQDGLIEGLTICLQLQPIKPPQIQFKHLAYINCSEWQKLVRLCWLTVQTRSEITPIPDLRSSNKQQLNFSLIGNKIYFSAFKEEVCFSLGLTSTSNSDVTISGSIPLSAVILRSLFYCDGAIFIAYCQRTNQLKITNRIEVYSVICKVNPPVRNGKTLGTLFNYLDSKVVYKVGLKPEQREIDFHEDSERIVLMSSNPEQETIFFAPECTPLEVNIVHWNNLNSCITGTNVELGASLICDEDYCFSLVGDDTYVYFTALKESFIFYLPEGKKEKFFRLRYLYPNPYFTPWLIDIQRGLMETLTDWTERWIEHLGHHISEDTLDQVKIDIKQGKANVYQLSHENQQIVNMLHNDDSIIADIEYVLEGTWAIEMYPDIASKHTEREIDAADYESFEELTLNVGCFADELNYGKRWIQPILVLGS